MSGGGPDQGMLDHVGPGEPERDDPDARWKATCRWLLFGVRKEPPPSFRGLYEAPDDPDRTGVCCSGGGIRSAAFNLGALQELQARKELQKARYLSAVSGGSYIASAFCMVAKTWEEENDEDSDPSVIDSAHGLPFSPGSPEEQYLRNHLSYLAPDGPAKVYLGLRMVAGLLINVLLIGLPVLIAGLLIGLALDGAYGGLGDGTVHIPDGVLYPILAVLAAALAVAVLDVVWRPRKDLWQTATQSWEVRLFLLAVLGALVLIAVPALAAVAAGQSGGAAGSDPAGGALKAAWTALSSVAALAVVAVAHVRGTVRDRQKELGDAQRRLGRYAKKVRELVIAVVVMLAGPLLLVAVTSLGVLVSVNSEDKGLAWLISTVVALAAMWIVVDLTTVSLHPFYRRRLASAFALRRVAEDGVAVARERPFDRLVTLSETDVGAAWPTLIVCAAANVSDPGATPPGRAVASFTFSPTAIGGPLTGAAATTDYEKLARNRRRDVTLPAAIAMSGAAVSPSMGKLTYRPLTFLLALANIRLGVWVLNPRHINEADRLLAGRGRSVRHRPRPQYLWKELFGRNRLDDKFLYVTDGGHYENLGVVELLRRGCRRIYCFDAGGGKTSKALGDAIALARAELNVDIDMGPEAAHLVEDEATGRSGVVCATGTIRYPAADPDQRPEGTLIYVRSVVSQASPWDLQEYQVVDGVFPHHSTFDQFFDDQKFEAYRRLGMCAAQSAIELEPRPAIKIAGRFVTQAAPAISSPSPAGP
jgi:hypothetical protein